MESNFQLESNKEKSKKTCLEKYGYENPTASPDIQEKIKQTCMERYGVENPIQDEIIKKKLEATNIERYGVGCVLQDDDIQKRRQTTMLKKYGTIYYSQTDDMHKKRRTRLEYKGISFDSKPELEFYKKCESEGMEIKRHPIKLEYFYNNKKHYYFPDFEVDGVLIEIKGRQFLNPSTSKWHNPFDHNKDGLAEAKFDCAIRNRVKIIYV